MINVDIPVLKINVLPSKPGELTYSHSGIKHDKEYRIPPLILWRLLNEVDEEFLLGKGQCFALINLMIMSDLQFLEHLVCWVQTDIIVIHGNLEYLMQNIVDIVDSRDFKDFVIREAIVKTLYI